MEIVNASGKLALRTHLGDGETDGGLRFSIAHNVANGDIIISFETEDSEHEQYRVVLESIIGDVLEFRRREIEED